MDTDNDRERQIQEFIRWLHERVEKHRKDREDAANRGNADLYDRLSAARGETEIIANAFCRVLGMQDKAKY